MIRSLDRRGFIGRAALIAGVAFVPRIAFAIVPTDRRFIFIIQRGAADGLNIVVPYADPAYRALRGALSIDPTEATKLDGTFALHPAMSTIGGMYGENQALFVHAVASPYRDRSHFDGQNVLETGGSKPYAIKDGWLNRLASLVAGPHEAAIALAPTIPMALRGSTPVTSYAPSNFHEPSDDLIARVGQLYDADEQLHPLWSAALDARTIGEGVTKEKGAAALGSLTAAFLTKPEGPRIAMVETAGWDTHNAQEGRLAAQLKSLDALVAALRTGMGADWSKTTVLVATEFGRTAAANGTGGTDHGTGSVAMLLGGAVRGGRVVADWPGLATASLLDARDLRPTNALDAMIAGAAAESLALDPELAGRRIFASISQRPITGLIA
ncbi:DUF1501 domain-containing protein [Novosphingobium sp. 1949]|uniref:DUF1501 domain-containing protein n=1 Tax=Novosphingobium organovorum TaxID=2930092 RepID=A0ABT0BH32_9SPHN|nr:DUF1501 domain-containing protein [Novosphingobium organovorum]MCJ2184096.1 DUF1501 domain-containing protein [Novosphingobium organovorum]